MKSSSLAAKVIGLGKATDEVKQHGMLSFPTHKRTRKHGLLITHSRQPERMVYWSLSLDKFVVW